jgi:hypothetical protein
VAETFYYAHWKVHFIWRLLTHKIYEYTGQLPSQRQLAVARKFCQVNTRFASVAGNLRRLQWAS